MIKLGILINVVMASFAFADEAFLAEKPNGLKPCTLTDANFNKCFAKDFEFLNTEWKDGIPGLSNVGSFDPIHIDHISIVEDNNNPVASLSIDLNDIKLSGISKMKVLDASYDPQKLITKVKCYGKTLKIKSKYDTKGRILAIPLNGNGDSAMKIDDVELNLEMHLKRRNEHGHIFTDLDKFRMEIAKVGDFHVKFDNLFRGNPELTEGTNAVINVNWQIFYEALGPAITRGIEVPLKARFKTIFGYVPATYLISDI